MACGALDEICAAMSTSKPFANDLGGEAEVGRASRTLNVGAVAVEKLVIRGNDD